MSEGAALSCANCPSFLTKNEAQQQFNKSINSPVCGRYGKVLGSPQYEEGSSQEKKLQQSTAKACDAYGRPMPARPVKYEFEVAFPNVDLLDREFDSDKADLVTSCASCEFFVRDDAVASEFGWSAGMCSAKGKLILPNRQIQESRGCEYRQFGNPKSTARDITLLPVYDSKWGIVNPITEYFEKKENEVNPAEYVTDKEVSPSEKAAGIRAWRKVEDQSGEIFSFLPIYDRDFFDEVDRALVPLEGSDEHPELYIDHFGGVYLAAVTWNELDETPALWSEPGTGKTELFRHLAYLMQLPFRRISITASTELDDLAGKMHFSNEEGTYFEYGRLPYAWMRPGVICIDEPNVGPPDVWQFLRPLTDNSKQLVLDQNRGETISRHDDCYMGMAMNQAWDARNVGAMQIGEADANRLFHVHIPHPPEALEKEIIKQRVRLDGWEIDDKTLNTLMNIAHDIRALIEQGSLQISWAIRPQIKVARAIRWFPMLTAYRRAIADYLEPETSQVLLDAVRAHIE